MNSTKKLVCSECGHTKFTRGQGMILTSIPASSVQDYICEKCNHIETITTKGKLPKASEIFIPADMDVTPAALDYETFLITGRGTILVPRSEQAILNTLEIGEQIRTEGKLYEIRGLERSMTLMNPPVEKSRAYKVIQVG